MYMLGLDYFFLYELFPIDFKKYRFLFDWSKATIDENYLGLFNIKSLILH